jgi:hypothetical protein
MENTYQIKNLKESILDPIKDKLNPDLWNNEKLRKSAKTFILKKIETWLDAMGVKHEIKHVFIIGSMAGYQYNDQADIDVNIVVSIPNEKAEKIRKILPNGHMLPGTKHPVNYYIENSIKKEWKKGPIYDVLKDTWINKPSKEKMKPVIGNFRAVIEIARFFIAGIDAAISEYESDIHAYETYNSYLDDAKDDKEEVEQEMERKKNEIIADLDSILIAKHMIKALRKEAFEKEAKELEISTVIEMKSADTSINNLIYKYIERLGYFEKINKILNEREKWNKL